MQKYRFFSGIIITLFVVIANGFSQSLDIRELYLQNRISEIEKALHEDKISDPDWNKFASALFHEDLDEALNLYIELYNQTGNTELRKLITDRISQYYYAKGLYDSAERLLEDATFRQRIFSVNVEKIYFGVQLGAFSTRENAENAKQRYSDNVDDLSIVQKNSGGKALYVVIAGQYTNRDDADKYKETLRNQYGYKGIVIQY